MDATEASVPAIAPEEVVAAPEDAEARFAKLEEEKENYRKAYLKEADKNKRPENLEEEEKMTEVARRVLAESHLADIAREQDEIIKHTLKENKELKLAQKNKGTAPITSIGTHTESTPVVDTLITPEQRAALPKNWTDKDIERYKANLRKQR